MNPHPRDGADDRDLLAQLPEADAAEQAIPAIPDEDIAGLIAQPVTAPSDADPADAWEQHLAVPGDDDEAYEHVTGDERPI